VRLNKRVRRIAALAVFFTFLPGLTASLCQAAVAEEGETSRIKQKLEDVERRRQELQERIAKARQKEQLALLKLKRIEHDLNRTQGQLKKNKAKQKNNEQSIDAAERSLKTTVEQEHTLTGHAAKRLREIYEGQRLTLLEMLFTSESLKDLLDAFYYQEQVAQLDRKLLDELRQKQDQLNQKRQRLKLEQMTLGSLALSFAEKASQITRKKLSQEQIAEKLRTERAFFERAERQLALESQKLEKQIPHLVLESERSNKNLARGSGKMEMPMQARITSHFGWRRHPIFRVRKFHTGIDLAGPHGTPVKAADSGNVIHAGWYGGYGKVVIISHGDGISTLYAHLSSIKVKTGANVDKGEVIGNEGSTGYSTGPHLHFEVRVKGKPVDPFQYVHN